MGLATLAVTEVSHVADKAEGPTSERPGSERSASAEARAGDCTDDAPSSDDADLDDELDGLFELGDEIATLAAHLHAATYRLLTLIAEFDRLRGWDPEGHRSCAHWLAFRTGIDLGAAREKVRAARALTELPLISASMEQGELSFAKVRALTRVATPESEGALLELARCSTAAQLERTARAWRLMCRFDENELEKIRHRSRCFSVFPDEEGMYLVRGRLDPEVGAMLLRAVDAASDALFKAGISKGGTPEEVEPKQRRADAVGLLAERALAVGFGRAERNGAADGERRNAAKGQGTGGRTSDGTSDATSDGTGEGKAERKSGADIVPLSGTRAERYQVVLYVDASTLEQEREPGRSELEDGTRVSAETSRRLSCDSSLVRLTKAAGGEESDVKVHEGDVLDVGRKTRTIPGLQTSRRSRPRP